MATGANSPAISGSERAGLAAIWSSAIGISRLEFSSSKTARLQLGRDHGHGKFRHRRIGLAATGQLGPLEEVPDRTCTRAHEEARPRRYAVYVRRERALPHRHAYAGLESAQAGTALCAPLW